MMDAIASVFTNHMVLVFLVYGLAWFTMGVAIVITARVPVRIPLATNLPWLAGFGFVHALSEWLDMVRSMPSETLASSHGAFITPANVVLLALSGVFLLRFGSGLVCDLANAPRYARWLPALLVVLWLLSPLATPYIAGSHLADATVSISIVSNRVSCATCHPLPVSTVSSSLAFPEVTTTLHVFARYLIYLPAMILSALGLYLQGRRLSVSGLKGLARSSNWAASIFGVHAFISGLVVAPAPYFPAAWLNYHSFVDLVAVPPQVFGAFAAVASSFFLVRVLDVYRAEQQRQLAEAQEKRLHAEHELSKELSEKMAGLTNVLADLHTLSERVVSDESFGGFIHKLALAASSLMRADGSTIYLEDTAGEIYVACAEGVCTPFGDSAVAMNDIAHDCVASHRSLLLPDAPLNCQARGLGSGHGSVLAVPLLIRQEVLGVISVQACAPRQFGDADVSLLETVSGQMAVALQNARLYAQVSEQAIRDGLTGLYNHRYFRERLEEESKRASQEHAALSLLFCDLDFFKRFNDTNGHQLGDLALRAVATILTKSKRKTDVVSRYGGEEFTVILPGCDTAGAVVVAERIRREVAGHSFGGPGQPVARLTISIGVATYPRDASSHAELIDKSDWAMYNAKRHGGNRVWAFSVDKEYARPPDSGQAMSEDLYLSTAHALAAAVDARDHYTHYHSEAVARYSSSMARELGLAEEAVEEIRTAALLHDIGKIAVRDDILNKNGPLTEEEHAIVREHPLVGQDILKQVPSLMGAASFVRHHHERYDGKGYPDRIAGEDIPLGARIIAVADAFHAMVSDRPYRRALSLEQALDEVRANAGRQFDPRVVDAFTKVAKRGIAPEAAPAAKQ